MLRKNETVLENFLLDCEMYDVEQWKEDVRFGLTDDIHTMQKRTYTCNTCHKVVEEKVFEVISVGSKVKTKCNGCRTKARGATRRRLHGY